MILSIFGLLFCESRLELAARIHSEDYGRMPPYFPSSGDFQDSGTIWDKPSKQPGEPGRAMRHQAVGNTRRGHRAVGYRRFLEPVTKHWCTFPEPLLLRFPNTTGSLSPSRIRTHSRGKGKGEQSGCCRALHRSLRQPSIRVNESRYLSLFRVRGCQRVNTWCECLRLLP